MFLTSTSDLVQVITGGASDIEVYAAWIDKAAATEPVAGDQNIASITTATTTTIISSPATSTARKVKHINCRNNHASTSCLLRFVHTDGTTASELLRVTLLAGEGLDYKDGAWTHYDANGGGYGFNIVPNDCLLGITGTIAETIPRMLCAEVNIGALVSGTLRLTAIWLREGMIVTNISLFSATTAAGTPTNGFFGLYNVNRALLARSFNFTTEAWAANTIKTKAMTAPYTVKKTGLYYIAVMITATTVPTLKASASLTSNVLHSYQNSVLINATADTGLTTSLPATCIALNGSGNSFWAAVN